MEHYYYNIGEDWFTYPNIYAMAVNGAHANAKFVEVGSWKGRSSCFMAVEILNSGKNIEFYCVDTWKGSEEHQEMDIIHSDNLYQEFIKNIEPVSNIIKPIRMDSLDASKTFEDETLDFVFIDAAHDYESVKKDIIHWYPKVKKNGILAGHDYAPSWGVKRAVDEWAAENNIDIVVDHGSICWLCKKK